MSSLSTKQGGCTPFTRYMLVILAVCAIGVLSAVSADLVSDARKFRSDSDLSTLRGRLFGESAPLADVSSRHASTPAAADAPILIAQNIRANDAEPTQGSDEPGGPTTDSRDRVRDTGGTTGGIGEPSAGDGSGGVLAVAADPKLATKLAVEAKVPLPEGPVTPSPELINGGTYAFTATTGAVLEDMSSGTLALLAADIDDSASAVTPIGFDFWYDGVRQTQFSVNANGLMRLGVVAVGATFDNSTSGLASATDTPKIAPYFDDMWIGNNNGKVHYKVLGSAPNRKLVIEWSNEQIPRVAAATAGAGTFQAWLYETTGVIEFVYGSGVVLNSANGGYSVGLSTSATSFASVTTSTNTVSYVAANNTQTNAITSGTKYSFTPNSPFAPGALSFTAVGLNGMTLNWADTNSNEVGYAIYRSVDGINYDFVRLTAANAVSSVETGLASNTTWFWNVYAVTEGGVSPASSGSQATLTGTPFVGGTKTVGPTGNYPSLTAAVADINLTGLAGSVVLELQATYLSAVETFPLVINTLGSPSSSITIRPAAGAVALSITSANTTATIDLNTATNVIIDGRAGGVGASQLTIANTATAGVAVRFINGASRNTIQFSTITGVNTSATSGVVLFSTSTGVTGNNSNTIDTCDVTSGATTPVNGITSIGTASTALLNTKNTISNNNISNYFSATVATTGVLVTTNTNLSNTNWTISNNRFFQTVLRTYTAAVIHRGILVSGGSDYSVTGNIVGFATSGGTGTYTMTATAAASFTGIQVQLGAGSNSVTGNTVTATSLTTLGAAGTLTGISLTGGCANIATNTVGSGTGTGALTLTNVTTTGAFIVGVNATGATMGTVNVTGNTIGSLTATGSATLNPNINATQVTSGVATISGNTIGSSVTANSIQVTTTGASATGQQVLGMIVAVNSPVTISGNTIANLTNAGTGTVHVTRGIQYQALSGTVGATGSTPGIATISLNSIHDISGAAANTTVAGGGTAVQGIIHTGASPYGTSIDQNTIFTISATNPGAVSTTVAGIGYSNPSNGTVTRNKIYDLRNASTGTSATAPPQALGILIRAALGAGGTFANNFISLGDSQSTNTQFVGLMNSFTTVQVNSLYNSVHIAGTVGAGALPSYGFLRGDNSAASAITTPVSIIDNIFNNTRTGGTGKHYAIGNVNTAPAAGWPATASNRGVLNSANPATVGIWGLALDRTFADWQTSSGGDANSLSGVPVPFLAPAVGDLHFNCGVTPTPVESHGVAISITTDYDNQTRPGPPGSVNGGATAPDIGADEFDCVPGCSANNQCSDGNSCTDDTCDLGTATCVFTPNNGNTCTDNNACTSDACSNGTCVSTPSVVCDDLNACTTDTCNPATGTCVFTGNNNPCNDGNPCTTNDTCGATVISSQNFDGVTAPALPAGWTSTTSGVGGALWVTTTASSDTAPNSALGTDGANIGDNLLVSNSILITSPGTVLTFRHRWSFEFSGTSCFDGAVLEISINGGAFTDIVTAGGTFISGGYTGTVSAGFSNPIGGRLAWCFASAGFPAYLTSQVTLPAAANGQPVQFRWRLGTDSSTGAAGENVDTITISTQTFACIGGPPPNCDDGFSCTLDTCDPSVPGGCVHTPDPTACNDNNPCTDDACDTGTGQCVYTPDDTNTCTDNSQCTSDACVSGACVSTPSVTCNDLNDCTDDTCNPSTGTCVFTNDDTNTCTDSNACTSDRCVNGGCVSTSPPLTVTSTGPITINDGTSTVSAAATPYPSTITIPSIAGTITAISVSVTGITHTFPDDVDIQLVGPTGAKVVLLSDAGGGDNVTGVNITFSDTAATNVADETTLVSGTFKPTDFVTGDVYPAPAPAPGGTLLSVFNNTSPSGTWKLFVADDAGGDTGSITSWTLQIALDCNDNDACTDDACDPLLGCVHTPHVCNDGNACTDDACDPVSGCFTTPHVCNDGNACTTDTCDPATGCVFTPTSCDDGNVCTTDACDPATGLCTHTPTNCDDGNACTNDACIQALVAPPCVVADNGGGTVTLPPAGCDYLSPQDVHEIIDGLPPGTTIQLGAIHRDFICHSQPGGAGVCSFPPPGPNDCDQPGGSLGGEQECSDSSLQMNLHGTGALAGWDRTITLPVSFETHVGPRTPGAPVQSFPTDMFRLFGQITNPGSGDPDFDLLRIVAGTNFGLPSPGHTTLRQIGGGNYTVDSFFDITYRIDFVGAPGGHVGGMSGSTTGTIRMQTGQGVGCTHTPVDCNDNNACTTETCDPATGCIYAPVDCNDNNPCTDDACDPATGCTHTPHVCNDGNACTADTCDPAVPGGCVYAPITCDDNNACTDDTCNPATGCVYTPDNTNLCTDNNPCTVDVCTNGVCISTGTVCDDGNPCTDDTCDPLTLGCTFTPDDTNTCSDGNGCTAPDTCQGGVCGCHTSDVCTGSVTLFENATAQTIPGGPAVVTSTITVSGVGPFLSKLRLPSFVLHSNNADLDITLTSPAGTIVTITSDNGGTNDNVYNGTMWDDDADPGNQVPFPTGTTFAASNIGTDTVFTNNVAKTTLSPEEPLGAFIGENPNGVWTLRISDDTAANGGTLSKWQIETTTLGQAPLTATSTVTNTTPVTITDNAVATTTVAVSGAGTQIGRLRLTTNIRHTFIGDLDITLTSPSGTIVTVVSDAGTGSSGNDNVYNGTLWDDKADPGNQVPFSGDTFAASNLITDTVTTNLVVKPTLVPEEPFAAFNGENPNGTWTLRLSDDATGDTGSITSWSLEIVTASCANPCTVVCNDNNPCTDDTCDPATGCVYTPNNNNTCTDGNVCTNPDACVNGTCVGTPISCDDGDVCTDDFCLPATGCGHNPNNAPCDDGNACTTNDHCSTGTCTPSLTENFDGVTAPALPAGWTSSVTGSGVAYSTTTAFADTIPNSAATDDPVTVSDAVLDSPSIAITSAAAQISFRNRFNLESSTVTPTTGFDGAVLEIKIGAGSFTDIVTAGGSFVTGGYTHVISAGFSSPIGGRAAWSGNSAGFITTTANLPASANGQSVIFRFRRASDSSLAATAPAGHWVDTITVTQPCPNICRGGGVTDCNDNNACTTDSCDPAVPGGCVHTPVICNDGNNCTTDTCDPASGCVSTPTDCNDNNACTLDACDPATGTCTHTPIVCNDNNACTDDTCNPASGCVYTPDNTNTCDDGNLCTTADHCSGGTCVGTPLNCSDGNACTLDACDPLGGCTHTTIDCSDHNKCTNDSCNPTTGCVNTPVVCNDGNACTTDNCDPAGGCTYTTIDCNDQNKCTNDSCNPASGCAHTPVVCNDNNACTNDACDPASGCTYTTRDCNDSNPCTNDSCNPTTGCVNTTISCDDGNACTTDACDTVGGCTHTTINCNDHNKCTNDSCNPATGCVTSPVSCDDGNACTVDACDPASGCSHTAVTCNDANACTNDSCNPATGCVYTPNNAACDDGNLCTAGDTCSGGSCQPGSAPNCDDANPCTTDSCNPATGCTHAPNPGAACNDGNPCTTGDACNTAGQCQGGSAVVCNDNNPCTADSCNPSTGCVSTPTPGAPCNDGNACTTGDSCNAAGQCASGAPLACNDNNPCTADSCNPATGCVSTPTPGAACSDGNACTNPDSCNSSGQCVGGGALNCDDGNQCTADACNPSTGCTHTPRPSGTVCNDGNACTTGDACNASGQCVGGSGPNCDDGNPCTTDTCQSPSGCTHAPVPSGTACSDGNACTNPDTCNATGQCQGGGAVNCDDGNQCTNDSCNPATGCAHAPTPGASCNDGNPCTSGDTCTGAGTCQGSGGVSCDDGNPCTIDSCTPSGCAHAPNTGAVCNDNNPCTTNDRCTSTGTCSGGSPIDCDDHNPCTTDSCNPSGGCVHTGGGDSDGDGVTDCSDACPNSIPSSVVVIDGCNTGVPNRQTNGVTICGFNNHCGHENEGDYVYDEWGHRSCGNSRTIGGPGCNIADLIQICRQIANCPQKWADCVEKVTKELKNQHIISEKQRNKIRKCVQRAIHGGRNPHSHSHTRHQDENQP